MKKTFLLLGLLLWQVINYAQNPVWSVAPDYLSFNTLGYDVTQLPIPPEYTTNTALDQDQLDFYYYHGQSATGVNNAQADAEGNLLFFIVDDKVYDKDGYLIDQISNDLEDCGILCGFKGLTEIMIIPEPGSCDRYYIFTYGPKVDTEYRRVPYYCILDFSVPNYYSEDGELGDDPEFTQFGNRNGVLLRNNNNTSNVTLLEDYQITDALENTGIATMAAGVLLEDIQDDERHLFFSSLEHLYHYTLNSNGLTYVTEFNAVGHGLACNSSGEMELSYYSSVPTSTNSNIENSATDNFGYKIAYPVRDYAPNGNEYVAVMDYNITNGTFTEFYIEYETLPLDDFHIHGLEFSPDGNLLYIAHTTNENHTDPLEYYDFTSNSIQAFQVDLADEYAYGQIEMGFNDQMYFAGENNISYINNPNTPPSNWSGHIPGDYTLTYQGGDVNSTSSSDQSYSLIDQIDGESDYLGSFFTSCECCQENKPSDVDFYIVPSQGTTQWNGQQNDIHPGSSIIYIANELRIPAGSTLELTNMEFRFAPDAKVVVEARNGSIGAGKLILNNTTFTSDDFCSDVTSCQENMWQGVDVMGHSNLSQSNNNQGRIELHDNSLIEHALVGVRLYGNTQLNCWNPDVSTTGGIIKAYNSTFRNNSKDVEYLFYNYDNSGYFKECNFIVDDQVRNNLDYLDSRMSMYGVRKIKIKTCNFEILGEALNVYAHEQRGTGLGTEKSNYTISGSCANIYPFPIICDEGDITAEWLGTNNSEITPTTFSNFETGIYSTANGAEGAISIIQSLFTNNKESISLHELWSAKVFKCKFTIPGGFNLNAGLLLHECSDYTIERNYFEGTEDNHIGIVIDNSGPLNNEIYLNDFHELKIGTHIQGVNGAKETGLEVLCGLYDRTVRDITLTNACRINTQQGSDSSPAGNIFEPTNYNISTNYHVSSNSYGTVYHSHEEALNPSFNVEPDYYTVGEIIPVVSNGLQFTSRLAKCPTHPKKTKSLLENLVIEKREAINTIDENLEVLIDGGNTEALLNVVTSSVYSTTEVRNSVLDAAPYVSNEVLSATINRVQPLNQWHLCEILLANSPLTQEVVQIYEQEAPLASFLDELVNSYQVGNSSYVTIKDERKKEVNEKNIALKGYIHEVLSEDNTSIDDIKNIMEGEDEKKEIQVKVELERRAGNTSEVVSLLSDYTDDEDEVWKQFTELELQMNPSNMYADATEAQISELESIAISGKRGSINAKVVLEIITGTRMEVVIIPPDDNKSYGVQIKQPKKRKPALAGVYPNPAQGDFYITYVLPTERNQASIDIYNLEGKLVRSEDITSGYGILQLNARNYEAGLYVFNLQLEGQTVATHKFTVVD